MFSLVYPMSALVCRASMYRPVLDMWLSGSRHTNVRSHKYNTIATEMACAIVCQTEADVKKIHIQIVLNRVQQNFVTISLSWMEKVNIRGFRKAAIRSEVDVSPKTIVILFLRHRDKPVSP